MDLQIKDKVAFVGGGSKGMGRAVAERLAAEGCKVAVVARGKDSIDEVVDHIRSLGGTAIGLSADLASRDDINAAVADVTHAFGSPDIVMGLNNDFNFAHFSNSVDELFEEAFKNLTMSQIYLARATVPQMQRKKWGRFIHIGSPVAKEVQLKHPHIYHNTVRPGTVAFLRTMANEVAADGVTVNAIGAGIIRTPSFDWYAEHELGFTPAQTDEWLAGKRAYPNTDGKKFLEIPTRRAGHPEEPAALVAFLASELGAYITGHWIAVDGGRHAFTF